MKQKLIFYLNLKIRYLTANAAHYNQIRDLMWFSDLENLLSIGIIFYQMGESYLNLFSLHKVENL